MIRIFSYAREMVNQLQSFFQFPIMLTRILSINVNLCYCFSFGEYLTFVNRSTKVHPNTSMIRRYNVGFCLHVSGSTLIACNFYHAIEIFFPLILLRSLKPLCNTTPINTKHGAYLNAFLMIQLKCSRNSYQFLWAKDTKPFPLYPWMLAFKRVHLFTFSALTFKMRSNKRWDCED